jgi:hypothetical protein
MDIEKNDVDISQLFLWKGEVPIVDNQRKEVATVYMRVVGDKDLNKARIYSLRRSAELRAALNNKKSDEYHAFISNVKFTDRETMIAGVKLLMIGDFGSEARRNVIIKFPKEPTSDAALEEHEAYQKKVDEFPEHFGDQVNKEMERLIKVEEKRLKKLSDDKVFDEYKKLTVNYVCQEEMSRVFLDQCTFHATYMDSEYKKRYFKSFSLYEDISSEVKDQLRQAYKDLELGMTELKKLPEATLSPQLGESQEETGK